MPSTPVGSPTRDEKSLPANVNATSHAFKGSLPYCLLKASAGTALRTGAQKAPSGGAGRVGKKRQTVRPPPPPTPSGAIWHSEFAALPNTPTLQMCSSGLGAYCLVHSKDSTQMARPDETSCSLLQGGSRRTSLNKHNLPSHCRASPAKMNTKACNIPPPGQRIPISHLPK